jgi:hypothetical protein
MPAGQLFVDCGHCTLRIHATIEHDSEASFLDAATAALRAFQKHRQTHPAGSDVSPPLGGGQGPVLSGVRRTDDAGDE